MQKSPSIPNRFSSSWAYQICCDCDLRVVLTTLQPWDSRIGYTRGKQKHLSSHFCDDQTIWNYYFNQGFLVRDEVRYLMVKVGRWNMTSACATQPRSSKLVYNWSRHVQNLHPTRLAKINFFADFESTLFYQFLFDWPKIGLVGYVTKTTT